MFFPIFFYLSILSMTDVPSGKSLLTPETWRTFPRALSFRPHGDIPQEDIGSFHCPYFYKYWGKMKGGLKIAERILSSHAYAPIMTKSSINRSPGNNPSSGSGSGRSEKSHFKNPAQN